MVGIMLTLAKYLMKLLKFRFLYFAKSTNDRNELSKSKIFNFSNFSLHNFLNTKKFYWIYSSVVFDQFMNDGSVRDNYISL